MDESVTIEFPCDYPIRVIGVNHPTLQQTVVSIVRAHAADLDETRVSLRDSSGGKYRAVRFVIRATGEVQLKALHRDLMADPLVKLVL